MKVIKKIIIVLAVLLAIFLIVPLFTGNTYHVERSVVINKDKSVVYSYIIDFNNFESWSPWSEIDPNMDVQIQGKAGKIGSSYSWQGNDEVGKGVMTIQDISENEIDIQLKFMEPYETTSPTRYIISELKEGTKVTWEMSGKMEYPTNMMLLFMDIDEQIGADFEKGLANLKKALN